MRDLLLAPVAISYLAIVASMFAFGLNFSYLTWSAFRQRNRRPDQSVLGLTPSVTVQLPVYNERYVATRIIDAVAGLNYPPNALQIQVLDDSTDDTTDLVRGRVAYWRTQGLSIEHVRRETRSGYKAGALDNGLKTATGDFIALFDADFIPEPDFLRRTVPVLNADERLAFVQGRWTHVNREQSALTRVQAMSIDGHFGIEQQARWSKGHCFNFNGTAGVWRRQAISDAGGWSQRTLTEDLDLSYRAYLKGWRAAYAHDVEVPAEIPPTLAAYRRQQHRWAQGSFQCAALLLPRLWESNTRLRSKITGTLHLGGYAIHLLLLSLVVIFPAIILLASDYPSLLSLFGLLAVLNLVALSPAALFLSSQQRVGRRWYLSLPTVALLTLVGTGMMLNTARAALEALRGGPGVFERTPKYGSDAAHATTRRMHYQGRLDRIIFVELAVAACCFTTVALAASRGIWAMAVYAAIFGGGLTLNATLTVWQTFRIALAPKGPRPAIVGPVATVGQTAGSRLDSS